MARESEVGLAIYAQAESIITGLESLLKNTFLGEVTESNVLKPPLTGTSDEQRLLFKVIVFIDYEPLQVEISVLTETGSNKPVLVLLKDASKGDVVLFARFGRQLVEGLRQHHDWRVDVSGLLECPIPPTACFECDELDEFEAELFEDESIEESMPNLWSDICSRAVNIRTEALKVLARWADSKPSCRPAIASMMVANEESLLRLLQPALQEAGPRSGKSMEKMIAEVFPLVVALKLTAICPHASEVLATATLLTGVITEYTRRDCAGKSSDLISRYIEMAARSLNSSAKDNLMCCKGAPLAPSNGGLRSYALSEASTTYSDFRSFPCMSVSGESEQGSVHASLASISDGGKRFDVCALQRNSVPDIVSELLNISEQLWTNENTLIN